MFDKTKIQCLFKQVPLNREFYTARFHGEDGAVSGGSIRLNKVSDTEAESFEWSKDVIHPEQPCWYFEYK